ncbi:hypothetical protein NQ317_019711 [Molorchus minor]|uniref:Uncharacterized protein n=1 Tax=Molorchus minor TaxID=1323400 RepID=A0ABQ9JQ15_9CUCU|nr:hypothetical protein NQ317_019711 [Molorchus minor]
MPSAKKTKRKRCAPAAIWHSLLVIVNIPRRHKHFFISFVFTFDFYEICDKFLSSALAEIIKSQFVLKDKKPIARRYLAENKQFALIIYFLSPKTYLFLSEHFMGLYAIQ